MWIKRIILFVGGLFVMSLGVGLSIKSGLGVTPISSIPYSLTLTSGANIGITTIIFNAILVFLQIPILKKRFNQYSYVRVFYRPFTVDFISDAGPAFGC